MMENNSHLFTAKFALKIGSQKNSVVIVCSQTAILNASSRQEKPKQLLTTSLGNGEGRKWVSYNGT